MTRLITIAACLLCAITLRAEMVRYEINLYRVDGSKLDYSLGQFPSRENCMIEISRVRIQEKGVRLQCDPVRR